MILGETLLPIVGKLGSLSVLIKERGPCRYDEIPWASQEVQGENLKDKQEQERKEIWIISGKTMNKTAGTLLQEICHTEKN